MTNRFQPIKSIRGDTIKAEDLRASILQAAVQGRLVPQDPNDEPAEELVKRIRAEKQRLIKEGKIKKERNVSEIHRRDGHWYETIDGKDERCIDDEIPFDIPDSWVWCRLNQLCNLIVDCPHSTPHYLNEDVGFYAIDTNCFGKSGVISHLRFVSESEYLQRVSRAVPQKNDIVYSREGSVGNAVILSGNRPICLGQRVMLFRPSPNIDSELLRLIISHSFFVNILVDKSKGIGAKHVNVSDIKQLSVPVPPYSEQARIVEKINSLLPHIERYGQIESEYSSLIESIPGDLRASILQAAVQGRLVPQDPNDEPAEELVKMIRADKQRLIREGKIKKERNVSEIYRRDGHWYETIDGKNETCIDSEVLFDVPESWSIVRLGSVIELNIGKTPSRSNKLYWTEGVIPWVSIGDMPVSGNLTTVKEKITQTGYDECFKEICKPGTLLMSFKLSIGKIAILEIFAVHNEAIVSINTIVDLDIIKGWYFQILPLIAKQGDYKTAIKGNTLNKESLSNLIVPIPPINEQKKIVEKIDSLVHLIERYDKVRSQFNSPPYDSKPKEDTE